MRHPAIAPPGPIEEAADGEIRIEPRLPEGKLLSELLQEGRLDYPPVLSLARQLLEALATLHARGYVHGALSPSVLLATPALELKLLDPGLLAPFGQPAPAEPPADPLHAAPERLLGGPLGPETDLFSVGCLLYQLTAWTAPGEPTDGGLLPVGLGGRTPPLNSLKWYLPPGLDFLVERLIQRDPALRYERAEVVLADLARIAGQNAPASPPTADLRRLPLCGQERLRDAIRQDIQCVCQGASQTIVVTGPAGAGKSRLLRDAQGLAASLGMRIHRQLPLPEDPAGRPGLVVVDDLALLTSDERTALRRLVAGAGGSSLGFLLACREEATLQALAPGARVSQHRVLPLGREAVRQLMTAAIGPLDLSEDLERRILRACGGNPRVLLGLVREWLSGRTLRQNKGRWQFPDRLWLSDVTPEGDLERRLRALSDPPVSVLRLVTTIGAPLDLPALCEIAGEQGRLANEAARAQLFGAVETLLAEELLLPLPRGLGCALDEKVLPAGRGAPVPLTALANLLERRGADSRRLCELHLAAGNAEEAVRHGLVAMKAAAEAHDDDAVLALRELLDPVYEGDRRFHAWSGMAALRKGQLAMAIAHLSAALDELRARAERQNRPRLGRWFSRAGAQEPATAGPSKQLGKLAIALGSALALAGRTAQLVELAERLAEEDARTATQLEAMARLLQCRPREALELLGTLDASDSKVGALIALARASRGECGHDRSEARATSQLAELLGLAWAGDAARMEEAWQRFDRVATDPLRAHGRLAMAWTALEKGDRRALDRQLTALDPLVAATDASPLVQGLHRYLQAAVEPDLAHARKAAEAVLEAGQSPELDSALLVVLARLLLGERILAALDPAAARAHLEEAVKLSEQAGATALSSRACRVLGEQLARGTAGDAKSLEAGRAEARKLLDRAHALADETGSPLLRGQARVALGRLELASGRLDVARTHLETAEGLFRALGNTVWEERALALLSRRRSPGYSPIKTPSPPVREVQPPRPRPLPLLSHPAAQRERPEEALRKLQILLNISEAMATVLDRGRLLQIALQYALAASHADAAYLFMGDPLELAASQDRSGHAPAHVEAALGLVFSARDSGKSVSQVLQDRGASGPARAALAVPWDAEGRRAVLYLEAPAGTPFVPRDATLMEAIARQLGLALQNLHVVAQAAQQERMAQEMDIAREVQNGLLPLKAPEIPGLRLAGTSRSALEVGGDLFDFIQVDEHRWGIVIGDVTGKGMPAALLMSTTLSFFRSVARGVTSPAKVMAEVNGLLCRYRASKKMFVACSYAVYDTRDRLLTIANGGQPLPMTPEGPLEIKGIPLGVMPTTQYDELQVAMTPGKALVLYGDGLEDVFDARKEKLPEAELERILLQHLANPDPAAALEAILADLLTFADGAKQFDDMTLVVLRGV